MSENKKNLLSKGAVLADKEQAEAREEKEQEIGGPKGPEPTRFGDWEVAGRCSDF